MKSMNGRWTPVTVAIALTALRKNGIVEKIDSETPFDEKQRKLTPGEACLLLMGPIFAFKDQRIALYRIDQFYDSLPLKCIIGRNIDRESLSDSAFGRSLDAIYKTQRDKLLWDISELMEKVNSMLSKIYHIDQTKIETYVIEPPECDPNAAKPAIGLSKSGRTDLKLYSASCITDDYRIIRYLVPYDGNEADPPMDLDAIKFLIKNTDTSKTTVCGDKKVVNDEIVDTVMKNNLGIVSKVPENYSDSIRKRLGHMAFCSGFEQSKSMKDYSFAEFTLDAGRDVSKRHKMRFVVYRSKKDWNKFLKYRTTKDKPFVESVCKGLLKSTYEDYASACLAAGEAQVSLSENVYSFVYSIKNRTVPVKRTVRGRIPQSEKREYRNEWYFDVCKPVIDEEKREMIADRNCYQVLITNLPYSDTVCDNCRSGARSEDVLKIYLDEYKVEHSFRLLKSGVGICSVFLEKPERENAMMFILALAAMLINFIDFLFKRTPCYCKSYYDMYMKFALVRVRVSNNELELDGYDGCSGHLVGVMNSLGLDENDIINALDY